MGFLSEVQLEEKFGPFVGFQEALGFVPNLLRAQTLLPRLVEAQAKLESAVRIHEGAISRIQKERILLSVSADRKDPYCVGMDSKVLSSLGVSDSLVRALLNDQRPEDLSAADATCLEFCLKLSRNAPSVGVEDIKALRESGFEDESILETVMVTALALYRCTLSVGLGPESDFGPPMLALTRVGPPPGVALRGLFSDAHDTTERKGPYVRAPYLSPKTFPPFAILEKSHGFIPNFFRAQTLRPDLLEAEAEAVARILLPEDVLTRVQKECILLAVSAANLNSYCVAMHCNLLRGLGMPSEEADQIAVDHHQSGLSEADRGLLDFAVKLGMRVSDFSRADIVNLKTLGFAEEQILECVAVTALNNFANTLQMGLGIEPDFEPPPAFQNKAHPPDASNRRIEIGRIIARLSTVQDPDAGLVAEAQGGRLEAFEELARRHSQLIYRALAAILGNQADAQDAMQDTLLSAFKHIGGFQGRSRFSTWLVSIARNKALQGLRDRKNVESLDQDDYEEDRDFRPRQVRAWQDNPEQCYSNFEIRQLIERGILGLPAKYRVVVMLRDIEQLSTDEVARQLGLSVPAVKVRLLRGRLMLREWLSPCFTTSFRRVAQ